MDCSGYRSAGWDLPRSTSAPRTARGLLAAQLLAWDVDEPERAAAAMIATELVTNAVQHAATPAQLGVHYDGVVVVIEVRDGCPTAPHLRKPTAEAKNGRGLQLVDRLAARWNWVVHSGGKTIWADIHLLDDLSLPAQTRIGRSDDAR
jgi:anti-sigma regulatory factor (Ser/Thr protein kinase)